MRPTRKLSDARSYAWGGVADAHLRRLGTRSSRITPPKDRGSSRGFPNRLALWRSEKRANSIALGASGPRSYHGGSTRTACTTTPSRLRNGGQHVWVADTPHVLPQDKSRRINGQSSLRRQSVIQHQPRRAPSRLRRVRGSLGCPHRDRP